MLLYSHMWDLILKAVLVALLVFAAMSLQLDERVGVFPMIVIIVAAWFAIYRPGLSTVASWLYARLSLGADVSFAEARRLTRLFQLDVTGKWVPLSEVKKLPKAERRIAVLAALETLGPSRRAMLV